MLLLTSYMDETGHSRHEAQQFNGMGGLLCRVEEWERFECRWDKMLKRFKIPYIHMTESRTMFKDWPQSKIEALSKEAWDNIEKIKPLPIGSILPMEHIRPQEDRFRYFFEDPYFVAMQDCMKISLGPLLVTRVTTHRIKVAMVFSDQVEFRYDALHMFEAVRDMLSQSLDTSRVSIDPPDFRNMREWGALQAADMVAYEIYKERERTYFNRPREARYGWKRILKIYEDGNTGLAIRFHDANTVKDILGNAERSRRLEEYWGKKRKKGDESREESRRPNSN